MATILVKIRDKHNRSLEGHLDILYGKKKYSFKVRKGGIAIDWWKFPIVIIIKYRGELLVSEYLIDKDKKYTYDLVVNKTANVKIGKIKVYPICVYNPYAIVTFDWKVKFIELPKAGLFDAFLGVTAVHKDGKTFTDKAFLGTYKLFGTDEHHYNSSIVFDGFMNTEINVNELDRLILTLDVDGNKTSKEWKKGILKYVNL